jgi:hypothetical protein
MIPAPTLGRTSALWSRITTREALGLSWRSLPGLAASRGHIADPRGLRGCDGTPLALLPPGAGRDSAARRLCRVLDGSGGRALARSHPRGCACQYRHPGSVPAGANWGLSLVDGAVEGGSPIGTAIRLGARRIIVRPQSQSSYDYSATAHVIARARQSTRRWIDDHGLERCEFPEQLSIHSH